MEKIWLVFGVEQTSLPFQNHPEFKTVDLDARQQLYRCIAEDLWNPARLQDEVGEPTAA